ncbi:hypothetical protein JOS77_05000 [Chromobacterium haemolyticum]|nr:hypothetical protein JOS77_05000 [Chromobacterium haemolyticum]
MPQRAKLILEIIVNFLLPWLCYRYGEPRWGEAGALMFSALPPVLWSVVELLRFRRVDALSLLVLLGIGLSLLAMLLGGDARLLLLRESLITGLIGCGFLAVFGAASAAGVLSGACDLGARVRAGTGAI